MTKYLNKFSYDAKSFTQPDIIYLEKLFDSFLDSCQNLTERAFMGKSNRINISMYESIFTAVCKAAYDNKSLDIAPIDEERLNSLKNDEEFKEAALSGTASKSNVETRLRKSQEILSL